MAGLKASDALFDRQVRHRIALERYATSEVKRILRFINEMERTTVDKVAVLRVRPDLTRGERSQLRALENFLRQLRLIYAEGYAKVRDEAFKGFEDLAQFEAEFQTGSLARAMDDLKHVSGTPGPAVAAGAIEVQSPTVEQLAAVIEARPSQGKLLSAWFDDMESAHVARIEQALRIGFVEGDGLDKMRERIANVWTTNKRSADAVIRTSVTHIAAEVAQETYTSNPDIVTQVQWVSILDSRTSEICRARDGMHFPIESGPRPPAHINCRSTVIPIMEGVDPPDRPTYAEWLRRQSAEEKKRILGASRYKLFTEGGLDLDRFVSNDGDPLTLDEIRAADPGAFRRAGL